MDNNNNPLGNLPRHRIELPTSPETLISEGIKSSNELRRGPNIGNCRAKKMTFDYISSACHNTSLSHGF